ncbi:nitrile hydratase subunit beta [Achromobacter denitrificans]
MNGVHDMGGAQCYGPIDIEKNEPVFHSEWEKRAFALTLAMGTLGKWNLDKTRSTRESLPPQVYLSSSYYQIWFEGLLEMSVKAGLITEEEARDGVLREPPMQGLAPLQAKDVEPLFSRGWPSTREPSKPARFAVGDRVHTKAMAPTTHTRIPQYCRNKPGVVVAVHGVHVFPDKNATGDGEQPDWLYTVRFDARELWGEDSTASAVHVDCWEPYLLEGK